MTDQGASSYINGINLIAIQGQDTLYYIYNGHGDVVAIADGEGAITNQYDYDIFGNVILSTEGHRNTRKYAGYYYDEETGHYYLNARYYDPKTARFITEDTYKGRYNDPLSLNLYTYCANNPIMYYDPTGHLYFDGKGWNSSLPDVARKDVSGLKAILVAVLVALLLAGCNNTFESDHSKNNDITMSEDRFKSIDFGNNHITALKVDGEVYSWGVTPKGSVMFRIISVMQ
jgi:RHS repeat-associated protein